ncbi:YIP1 family protein [Nocardiopsis sp. ATB16-24]|uniref:YIP1 family protein n=1 Tax=Nocardiopsis sp. ATB16-24 TaxID=3019555 RepID=UPI002554525A|nr:YIP1 family protein [Nocardiopsis sp. ATB16-24]
MFRHLAGFLAGVALAPVLWIAAAWSSALLPRLAEGEVTVSTVSSAVVLFLLGAVCAYLVVSRVSPLVAGAGGVLLLALCLWPVVHPSSMEPALSWLNEDSSLYPSGAGLALALPLGTLLAATAVAPPRWRVSHGADSPSADRVVATTSREEYRRSASEPDPVEAVPGDTLPEVFPEARPMVDDDLEGDPNKTTIPFRRGETGAVWTPLEDAHDETGTLRDRPR